MDEQKAKCVRIGEKIIEAIEVASEGNPLVWAVVGVHADGGGAVQGHFMTPRKGEYDRADLAIMAERIVGILDAAKAFTNIVIETSGVSAQEFADLIDETSGRMKRDLDDPMSPSSEFTTGFDTRSKGDATTED